MKSNASPLNGEELVDVFDPETLVPVMLGTGYYANFQKLIEYHCREKGTDALEKTIDRFFKSEAPADEWEAHLYTMLQLTSEFEDQAAKAGFVKKIPLSEYLEAKIAE